MKKVFNFMTIISLAILLFFSQLVLSPQDVSAAQPKVLLSAVKGEVFVKNGGGLRELPAVNGMELVQGDWLRTGKTGTAKLIYEDGTEATIGVSSSLNIQQLSSSETYRVSALTETEEAASQGAQQSSIQLWSGSVWSKVKSLLNVDDKYEVETPTAVMGVRGTLVLVRVNPADGETQSDVIEGVVGVTQAGQTQYLTMGYRLVSSDDLSPDQEVIDPQELIRTTPTEILVQLVKDIIERAKELAVLTEDQQQAYEETGLEDHLRAAIGTSFRMDELATFGQEFMTSIEESDQAEAVKQVLSDQNESFEQVQSTMDTLKNETEELRSDVVETAKDAGVSEEQIEEIEKEFAGVPSITDPLPTPDPTPTPSGNNNDSHDPVITEEPIGAEIPLVQNTPITFAGGIKLDLGSLLIPSGATVKAEEVTPSELGLPDGASVAGKVVKFTFTGMTVDSSVSLSLPFNADADPSKVGIFYLNGSVWDYQNSSTVSNGVVVALVNHFSTYGVLATEAEVPSASNSTVSYVDNGDNTATITLEVKNARGVGIEELTADDFTVKLRGQSYVVGQTLTTFRNFEEQGNGVYEVTFAPGFGINETVEVVVKTVTIETMTVVITDTSTYNSTPPDAGNVLVTNDTGEFDSVTVSGLLVGDSVKVYDAVNNGNLLKTSEAVEAGNNTAIVRNLNLGYNAGSIWLTVTSLGKNESSTTQIDFAAETTLSVSVTPITPDGSVRVTVVGEASHHFAVSITDARISPPNAGDLVPDVANLINPFNSGGDISSGVAAAKYLQVFDVDVNERVVRFFQTKLQSGELKDNYYQGATSNEEVGPSFKFEDIRELGTYNDQSDDSSFPVPLNFDFTFYGIDYNEVFVGTNGYLTFGKGDREYDNYSFPVLGLPRIAPFFDDLIVRRENSGVYYLTEGTAPNRRLIVLWCEEDHYSTSPNSVWFEAILYEGTNQIEFQYQDTTFGDEHDYGRSATVGIDSGDGENAIQFSYNYASLADGFAIVFNPKELTDITVPAFEEGYPTIGNVNGDSMDLELLINEKATAYYLMVEAEDVSEIGTVTAEVVTSWVGGDHEDLNSWSGSISVDADETTTRILEHNIVNNKVYSLYIVAEDMSGNFTEVIEIEVEYFV